MDFNMDHSIGFILNRTATAVKKEFTKRLKPYDITPEQWSILNRLGEQDGVTQKKLSDRTYKDQPNTTRILDKLEKKGLIRRADNPEDRRAFIIFITDKGKDARKKITPITAQLNADASQGLNENDLNNLLTLLNKVYTNF
ncbi:DNA-binding transcriptional regulator, MarR family [Desulfocicer vacuolatum DSM 3385]|uniref:DNA-binding transcriptional regulator, MarR family n=1 Tax=Desulfocicer vacuolatum DSM 3385 TaxID=1121400 RepID=A0A1W2EUM2_9BACT|nr:MarR family transcriptional regulator [Desulfocicer vacuolatum]SMD13361.1 DNA-binding transcriptional regulator, MarR family [Desulfocicer vacuolatum DSM 3385]